MKNAPKPDHLSLGSLITRLREGRFVIPDFQREFEWEPRDILELMRSLFLDYYIGSLLLWRGTGRTLASLACEPLSGYIDKDGGSPEHIVLDGQQRLTAMYYTFIAPDVPAPRRKNRYLYFVRTDLFADEEYDEAFVYDWTQRGVNLIADRTRQFREHMFPLALLGDSQFGAIFQWIDGYRVHWEASKREAEGLNDVDAAERAVRHLQQAADFAAHLNGMLQDYQVSYIELDQELPIDKVCDTFTRINSRGIRLDVFDLINALLKPREVQLKSMWREAEPRLEFVDSDRMNVYVLQVMSLLGQDYCSPKYLYYLLPGEPRRIRQPDGSLRPHVLVPDPADFVRRWEQAVDVLERGIKLLRGRQDFGAISSRFLPYVSIVPAFCAAQEAARNAPAASRLAATRKVRDWYWASVFTNRYSGSVESTTARDVLSVRAWIEDDGAQPDVISELAVSFRDLDLLRETKRGTSVYNGIFNVLVLRGAQDWVSGAVPVDEELDDHHIVPQSWGREHGVGSHIDSILNRTPLTADTNRNVIRDRLPCEYLPALIAGNDEGAMREILDSHFISADAFSILLRDPFTPDDFEAFLGERRRTLQAGMEDLLVKGRLDLTSDLRRLDAQIESVELKLRILIDETLARDETQLPGHMREKLRERSDAALRRQPGLNLHGLAPLNARLEYADLHDLREIISSKHHWPSFETRFRSKGAAADSLRSAERVEEHDQAQPHGDSGDSEGRGGRAPLVRAGPQHLTGECGTSGPLVRSGLILETGARSRSREGSVPSSGATIEMCTHAPSLCGQTLSALACGN